MRWIDTAFSSQRVARALAPTPQLSARASYGGEKEPHTQADRGKCPVWGSEFTSKDAALQGGSAETAPTLNVTLWVLVVAGGGILLPPFRPFFYLHRNLKPTRSGPFRGSFAGVDLCFCTSRLAARCPARVARCPKRAATQTAPGRTAVGTRRVFLPQAPAVQTCVSAGAPTAALRPSTQTRRRYVAARINLPLY
jgi:hypothetical protein